MFIRSSTKSHSTLITTSTSFKHLTKHQKCDAFDDLVKEAISACAKYSAIRHDKTKLQLPLEIETRFTIYNLIFHAPFLTDEFDKNIFTRMNITQSNVVKYVFEKLDLNNKCGFTVDMTQSDINHISKHMIRYHFDFSKAFNFWAVSNQLKTDLNYKGTRTNKLGNVVQEINLELLNGIGKKLGLNDQNMQDLYPALLVKMNRSCSKAISARQEGGIFNSYVEYNKALASIPEENAARLGMKNM